MLQNAYFLAKIGADTAENEQHFAEILPKIGNYPTGPPGPVRGPSCREKCGSRSSRAASSRRRRPRSAPRPFGAHTSRLFQGRPQHAPPPHGPCHIGIPPCVRVSSKQLHESQKQREDRTRQPSDSGHQASQSMVPCTGSNPRQQRQTILSTFSKTKILR